MIHYAITPANPSAHIFEVSLTINADCAKRLPEGLVLRLPAWIPGSYMIRDFAKNIVELSATANGESLPYTRVDKSTWQLPAVEHTVVVKYSIYAWDLSVRSAHLDQTHGFVNGTSTFLEVVGCVDEPHRVTLLPPHSDQPKRDDYGDWRVATSLTRNGAQRYGFGDYIAQNYDDLIDHPVEMGAFTLGEFTACGVPHVMAITGQHEADMERLCKDLTTICEYQIKFFGEPAPVDEYVFMTTVTGDAYGGLEHRASTALMSARHCLPYKNQSEVNDDYISFLGLCSHEYFHTWNVKRIKPAAFSPFDLSTEQHTELLWAFEGITSYYDDLILVRTGLITPEQYLGLLAKTITRVQSGAGRLKQPIAESSFDAWTKFYKQDENAPNAIVSYYAKGTLVALCLDAFIQKYSNGKTSLDDLMRTLWQRYGLDESGLKRGVPEQEIPNLVWAQLQFFTKNPNRLRDEINAFFETVLYTTQELPLAESLAYLGVDLNFAPKENDQDTGRYVTKHLPPQTEPLSIGARLVDKNAQLHITHVFDGGAAQQAGLSAGDVVVAVDGLRASKTSLARTLKHRVAGDQLQLTTFRRDELMTSTLVLQNAPHDSARLSWLPQASESNVTQQWLALPQK